MEFEIALVIIALVVILAAAAAMFFTHLGIFTIPDDDQIELHDFDYSSPEEGSSGRDTLKKIRTVEGSHIS